MPTSRFLTSSMRFLLNQARVRQGFSIEARDSRGVDPKAFGPLAPAVGMRHALDSLPSRRSEEHTSELQSLMRTSYAVFCLKKKKSIHILLNPYPYHITRNLTKFCRH